MNRKICIVTQCGVHVMTALFLQRIESQFLNLDLCMITPGLHACISIILKHTRLGILNMTLAWFQARMWTTPCW